MLLVPTYLAESEIHGTGLFAAEHIPARKHVWVFQPGFDARLPIRVLELLPAHVAASLRHYGYVNPRDTRYAVVPLDDARFWNFCASGTEPNCAELSPVPLGTEAIIVAARDIEAGEELTLSTDTDADAARKLSHS